MKGIKIVQSGDFHLDSPLTLHHLSFRKMRREELLFTVKKIIDFSNQISADLLLLTGDLFDSTRVTKGTLDYLYKELEGFQGRVFITPGNHDPYENGSQYDRFEFPKNTHIFREYEEVYLEELDAYVCGQGFTSPYERENQLKGKVAPEGNSIKILLMHGEVTTGINEYNPITPESIGESQFSYIAIGHRHEYSGILRENRTCYAYAGIPEGRGFDESGDKGVIYGHVYKDGVDLAFKKLNIRGYKEVSVDLSSCITQSDMVGKILSALESKNDIPKIILKGILPNYIKVELSELDRELSKKLKEFKLVDSTKVSGDSILSIESNTLKGLFIKTIEEKKSLGLHDQEMLEEAKILGLRILSQEDF
ncbi:MAG: metallophosphoesterase [Clostridiaceae bacterium]